MVEVYLIITGLVFFAWLYALVRQAQRGFGSEPAPTARPVVPVNLMDSDEAVIVAEGHGRIVYANPPARQWFDINGGAPNLSLMASMTQPADTLHDLMAEDGHASFRLGQRQIEAVSHTIPAPGGRQMVVVMRERTSAALPTYHEFDPVRALAILQDISQAVGSGLSLTATVDVILHGIEESIEYDAAEITLWHADKRELHPVGRGRVRTHTGSLAPASSTESDAVYRVGEGYGGWIASYRQPLLITDVSGRTDLLPRAFQTEFQSYLGVPLSINDKFIGTLELVNRQRAAFTQRDLSLLQAIGGQVAAAVEGARIIGSQYAHIEELSGLQQIAEAMSQLADPTELYGQLAQRIAALMDVEICGVLLYDEDDQLFRSQPPFYGVPDSLIAHYRLSVEVGTEPHEICLHKAWWYSNAPTPEMINALGFENLSATITIRNMALAPMTVGARRTGLMLVANRSHERSFTGEDTRALVSYAAQAGVVSENARLYVDEQRRARELGGLQQIAQAMGFLRSPSDLYSQITERIAALMNVEMCGILIFDAHEQCLVSQRPFYGMDDVETISFYQVPSPRGGPVDRLWRERDMWFTNDIRTDPVARDTDLAQMATAVGIRQTVIAPLVVAGNRLGIIQVSNRLDRSEFTEDDARILSIFAGQAAILIDNARLYREMQSRTHEAEGLRAVTEIASQVTPTMATVERVIIAISNLLETHVVSIALVDERSGELVLAPDYVWGMDLPEPYRFDAYGPGFEHSVLISRHPFMSNNLRDDPNVLEAYRPIIERFGLTNSLQVPLIIQDRSIGELSVANKMNGEPFTEADLRLLQALANQVAAMVDRMRLYQDTDQGLRARVQELDALGRVSHELSQTLELDRILDVIRQEALRSTDATAVSVVLLSDREEWLDPDRPEIDRRFGEGRELRDLASIERAAIIRNDVMLVDDYDTSSFEPAPRLSRSALVVPVTFGEYPVGLIHLFSTQPGVFNRRVVDFVIALTDAATVAIGNARRYEDQVKLNHSLRVRAERMGRIFQLGEMFRQGASLAEMLEEVAHSIQETIGFNIVLISLADDRQGVLRRTAQAGLPLPIFHEMQATTPPLEQARTLMQPQFRISNSYFLPAEGAEDLIAGLPVVQTLQQPMGEGPRAWDPEDLLIVPLYGSGGSLVGIISVDEPRSGRRPDFTTVEALEIFASQGAFAIENYRLIRRIQEEAEATRRERDRLAQLHMVASEIQAARDVPSRLQVVADGIHDAGWKRVVITLRDEHLEATAMIQAGHTPEEAMYLSDTVETGAVWRRWINDLDFYQLKLSAGYYMRYNHPWVRTNIFRDRAPEPPEVLEDQWHPQDVLYLPLVGQDQKRIIGIIAMYDPVDGQVPTEDSLQPFELFASQAAAAIETTRLYMETVRAAEQEQRINEVMEAVSGTISPEAVIQAVGHGLQQMVPFTRMCVTLYDSTAGHLDVLRADIALDMTVTVVHDQPMSVNDTAMGRAFRDMKATQYQLSRDEAAREMLIDLKRWYATGERSTLIVPMIAGGQAVGSMRLGSELENAFGFQENSELIQRLANLSAVALENARLFSETRERAAELDAQAQRLSLINRVSSRLAQSLDVQEIYRIALAEMQEVMGAQYGGVLLHDQPDSGLLVLDTHPEAGGQAGMLRVPLGNNTAMNQMRRNRRTIVSEDIQNDPRLETSREILQARGTRAIMLVPLLAGQAVVGSIGLDFTEPHIFTEAEIGLSETIASQVSVALEKANLLSETAERAVQLNIQAQRLASLNRISERLAALTEPRAIYYTVLKGAQEALGCQSGGLMMIEGQQARLMISTHPNDLAEPNLVIPLAANPLAQAIIETHQPVVIEDVATDPRLIDPIREMQFTRGTHAMLIVPMLIGDRVIGTIGLDSSTPRIFTDSEIELALTAANQAAVAVEKARLYTEAVGLTVFNQAVVESIQQGIVVMDKDLVIRRVNSFMAEWYGWSTTEAPNQRLFDYRPDYETFLREPMAIALGMGVPQACDEIERRDASGQVSIRNYYVYPMLDDERRVTGIVLLLEDVTERALLERDLNVRAIQMAALSEVSGQLTSTLETAEVLDLILDVLGRVVPYDGVTLWLRSADGNELTIEAARGYRDPDSPTPADLLNLKVEIADSALFRDMAERAQIVNVGDVGAGDPRFPHGSAAPYKNWLGAPLISKGNVVGVLSLEKRERHFYNALHEQLALTFANQAAVALDNARMFEETRDRAQALDEQAQRLALLNRVSLALAQTLDLENIMEIALRETAIALNIQEGMALKVDKATQHARVIVEYPRGNAPPIQVFDITDNRAIHRVQQTLVPLVVEDLEHEPLAADLRAMMRRENVCGTLIVPLVVGGEVIGMLRLDVLDERRQFTSEQVELAQTITSQAAIAVQNATLFEQSAIRTTELETLFESAQATAVTLDLDEVVRRVTVQMLGALHADACTVFLWDDVTNQLTVRGDISARPEDVPPIQAGDVYNLTDYPLRERALRERELITRRFDDDELPPGERELMMRHNAASRMLIPLIVNEISIGLVEVETLDPTRYFLSENERLARTLASQAAISIENARLQTETRRTVEEMYIINDMSAALSSANDLDSLLGVIDAQLPSLTEAQALYVALYHGEGEKARLTFPLALSVMDDAPLEMAERPIGNDEFSTIIKRKAPLLLAGENLADVRRSLSIETVVPEAACFLGVPLFAGIELIGVLAVRDDHDPTAFSHNDQRILTTVGSQLGVAIQSTRLLQRTLQQAEELDQRVRERTAELEQERQNIQTLYQITTELATSLDMERLLSRALEMVSQAIGATGGAILAVDPISERLIFRASLGNYAVLDSDEAISINADEGLAGWAVQNRQGLIVDDVRNDPRWLRMGERDDQPRAAMVALIESNEDVLGVMMLYSGQPAAFRQDQLRLVSTAANQVANAMNNAELYSLIRDQAERLGSMLRTQQVEATKSDAILDSVADGVMVANENGQVIVFNQTASRMLNLPVSGVLNRNTSVIAGLYQAGTTQWAETVERWMHDPASLEQGQFLEERITLEDARIINVRLSPVHMGDQFLGTVSIFRDITREVELDHLKSEFVATVSHELRTPMTSIKGYADLLLLGAAGPVSEQQGRFLDTIKQNADRLSILVNDLLDISRIDQGRMDLTFSEIEVPDLLKLIADHVRGRSEDEKRPMTITVDLPDGVSDESPTGQALTIWGDYDKIAQIMTNLADNAFSYTPPGGNITFSAVPEPETGQVVLQVTDSGIGIPPEVGKRIFERFFRGDESHDLVMDTPGTGLGLAIVQELVQVHHGTIWFESEVGHGSTFYVSLPAQPPESPETAAAATAANAGASDDVQTE
ncbi:MAG: GAF domain-containing protein [Anaerolineae bacterium]|nr:GAF domain-containing protein [Anaerolineae bacterium]